VFVCDLWFLVYGLAHRHEGDPIESVLRAREGFDPKDLEPLSLGASRLVLGAANGTP
jgi:hypothetical protein